MTSLTGMFGVASVDSSVVQLALQLTTPDFENAVTAAAAQLGGCNYVVSRDSRGFRGSPVPCLTPEDAIPILEIMN